MFSGTIPSGTLFPGRRSDGRRPGRRAMLRASVTGLAGLTGLAALPGAAAPPGGNAKAKSTILFFLCGGSSHVDLWDMKPAAPAEYRGEFRPVATTAPGLAICEHLPLTAKQGHPRTGQLRSPFWPSRRSPAMPLG
jgi:hypothetical protein